MTVTDGYIRLNVDGLKTKLLHIGKAIRISMFEEFSLKAATK